MVILTLVGAAMFFAVLFDAFEMATVWLRAHEGWEADEILSTLSILSVGFAAFSLRRWSELRHEISQKEALREELSQREARFRSLIENTSDVITVLDAKGVVRFGSASLKRILGYSPEELVGRSVFEFVHPDDTTKISAAFRDAVSDPDRTITLEYRFRHQGGSWRTLESKGRNQLLNPAVAGIVINSRDITERKQGGEVLRAAKEEAERANRAKSEFLSRMSHELRTPLNAILGFGQLLEMEVEKEENQESVEQVLNAGKHLLALIDEVLDIARIEAGQMKLSVEPVCLGAILHESVDLVRLMAADRGITLRTQAAFESEQCVLADPQRLKQVLLNLFSNAIKYNREEGTVTVCCEWRGQERLRLVIQDTGYGIPAAKIDRLFTPFDRLGADQTAVEGTGLGLALSKGLMEAMGGGLGVESVQGEGSRFWVELPLAAPSMVAEPAPSERPSEIATGMQEPTHTVLLVEDNLANVRLMGRVFQYRPGLRLLTAMQGTLGLELAREHLPDLILLDVNLPGLSGDKVLLQLREDPVLRHIPVFMISGDAIPSQVERMLHLGAQGYLTKPFDVQALLRKIDETLLQKKL